MVYKSFDELLKLKRIVTQEFFTENIEAAIIGGEKGDVFLGDMVKWYDACKEKWTKKYFVFAPDVMKEVISKHFDKKVEINNINDEIKSENILSIIDSSRYFYSENKDCFCEHKFKGSWLESSTEDCVCDNLKIFICAHKPIENYLPRNKSYVILDVTGKADNSYNENFHEKIDISNDEFVKSHNVCYGEGCVMKYLYNHQNMIPEYVGMGHYRRLFINFIDKERLITRVVNVHGAIINSPSSISTSRIRVNNKSIIRYDHPRSLINVLIECVKETSPEYCDAFNEFLQDKVCHYCNCFVMKKKDFLEMCEFCFRVLDRFDEKLGFKNNDDVKKHMETLSKQRKLNIDNVEWQSRLQGFLLEYLTDTFYRYKFGVKRCCKSSLGIPVQKLHINII